MEKKDTQKLIERYLSDNATGYEKEVLMDLIGSGEYKRDAFGDAFTKQLGSDLQSKALYDENALSPGEESELFERVMHSAYEKDVTMQLRKQASVRPLHSVWKAAAVVALTVAALWYGSRALYEPEALRVITFTGPKDFYLPDSTLVLLKANSELSYNENFGTDTRDINIKGEAFVDVTHDAQHPFIVHTGDIATEVLGTAFSVNAYAGQPVVTITVARGKVKVADKDRILDTLIRNQQLVINLDTRQHNTATVDTHAQLVWCKQFMVFDNQRITHIARMAAAVYGVQIEFTDNSLKNCKLTTSFADMSMAGALKAISTGVSGSYTLKNGVAVISGKQCE